MVKINQYYAIITVALTLAFSFPAALGKIISDTERMGAEPSDRETHGEDIAYQEYLRKQFDAERDRQDRITEFSKKYSEDLVKHRYKRLQREAQFPSKNSRNNQMQVKAQLITGTRSPSGIKYNNTNIKTGGVHLGRLQAVINHSNGINAFICGQGKIVCCRGWRKPDSTE